MSNYRKKPVVIQAVQFIEVKDGLAKFDFNMDQPPEWLYSSQIAPCPRPPEGFWCVEADHLVIGTLEGMHIASPGDFIIRGLAGELYPCKPDIFLESYSFESEE
jgi:hypothetical protein